MIPVDANYLFTTMDGKKWHYHSFISGSHAVNGVSDRLIPEDKIRWRKARFEAFHAACDVLWLQPEYFI